jgi:hypothetical protein
MLITAISITHGIKPFGALGILREQEARGSLAFHGPQEARKNMILH